MSDTPRTDEFRTVTIRRHALDMEGAFMESVYFARDLERENTSLREQLRVAQERWISVNERLPQLTEPVFVLLRLSDEHKNVPAVAQLHHDRWITTWRENVEVTHWMPLPTPPAESTDGKT
jgi:hypothetical protein